MKFNDFEKKYLASYAMLSIHSRGRRFPEPDHLHRTAFQRDRDRIIHSTAFRRLEYKTQVFLTHEGDYYRTRLTHTLEVAQIARTISRLLRLNEDLTEAIALAHDLGHTPFGHAGEEALNNLMKDYGGFNHNLHGLKIVDELEEKYPLFNGLNLTYEVREGILKHSTPYDPVQREFRGISLDDNPTLEAQVVDLADEIAYNNHDLDDALEEGLITLEALQEVDLWQSIYSDVKKKYSSIDASRLKSETIRSLINAQVLDVIEETKKQIEIHKIRTVDDVRKCPTKLVLFSPVMAEKNLQLRNFLMEKVYRHPKIIEMTERAKHIIKVLFETYMENSDLLSAQPKWRQRLEKEKKVYVICDYIAAMTDRYAQEEYRKITSKTSKKVDKK